MCGREGGGDKRVGVASADHKPQTKLAVRKCEGNQKQQWLAIAISNQNT